MGIIKRLKKLDKKAATLPEVLVYASLFLMFALSLLYISISVNKVYRILVTKNQSYIFLNKCTNILTAHLVSNPPLDDSTPPYTLDMSNNFRLSVKPACSSKLILYDIDSEQTTLEPYQLRYKKKYIYLSTTTFNNPPWNDGTIIEEYEGENAKVIIDKVESLYFFLLDINGNYVEGDKDNPNKNISGYSVMAVLYINEQRKNDNKLLSDYVVVSK
ncbi:MAG: hypothetical protein ACP5O4_07455 [bacterium]